MDVKKGVKASKKELDFSVLRQEITRAAQYDFDHQKVFGCAYSVYQGGHKPCRMYFGSQSPDGDVPVTGKTVFRIASMTKPVTAVAMLLLADRGLISLDDPLAKYLPEFSNMEIAAPDESGTWHSFGKAKSDPTILQVLTHTAGIGSEAGKYAKMTLADKSTLDATLHFLAKEGLDFEPGSRKQYNSIVGFDPLVKIAEQVTGIDYLRFLHKELFTPCRMEDTTFIPSPDQRRRMITMHDRTVDGKSTVGQTREDCAFRDYPFTHYLGGAGLLSTLDDYVLFAKMLLDGGEVNGRRILSEKAFEMMHTPQLSETIMPGGERWGIGVRVIVGKTDHDLPVGAYGWSGAFGSHFWVDPVNRIAAVFMKNSYVDGGGGNESARLFEKAVYTALRQE